MSHKGLSLIEMLIVIGILSVLLGVSLTAYSRVTRSAERAKAQELVSNVATALAVLYQKEGIWPKRLAEQGGTDGRLDYKAALALSGYLGLNTSGSGSTKKLIGLDKFGIVSPWAKAAIKSYGEKVNSIGSSDAASIKVPSGGTAYDHILHYALDLDGDGVIKGANVGGASVSVRASAIVWCCGRDGKMSTYSGGVQTKQCDDVYSWTVGQTKDVGL